MTRQVLTEGLSAGRGPRDVALDIVGRLNRATGLREGGFIGLTTQQAGYAASARDELLSGDPARLANYLRRARRNAQFDGLVRKAIASGKPMSVKDADRIAGAYRARLLKLRGETIARTESITALGAGQYEGYQQLVDSGQVREDQIVRTWSAIVDMRTRHDHVTMNKKAMRGLSQPFTAPDGSRMMYPRDVSLGASGAETINCRCWLDIRVKYL